MGIHGASDGRVQAVQQSGSVFNRDGSTLTVVPNTDIHNTYADVWWRDYDDFWAGDTTGRPTSQSISVRIGLHGSYFSLRGLGPVVILNV